MRLLYTPDKAMSDCCEVQACEVADKARRRVLAIVLVINAVLFAGVLTAGVLAGSNALKADSLDSLGDALVYALSFAVVGRSLRWRAGAALAKGSVQLAFGILVFADAIAKIIAGGVPAAGVMAIAAAVAFVGNLACFLMLTRHRHDDVNMRSVWLCSRNDLVNNVGVVLAAGLVAAFGSFWPDVIIGMLIAALFIRTSLGVFRDAIRAWSSDRRAVAGS